MRGTGPTLALPRCERPLWITFHGLHLAPLDFPIHIASTLICARQGPVLKTQAWTPAPVMGPYRF